jgi:iron complex transport system substrate-binding protein
VNLGRLTRRAMVGTLAAAGAASGALAAAAPRRVVSLNPCLDAILVHVADRGQIAALSHYSREREGSSIADIAATLPIIYETAEEVVALRPDLALASRPTSAATLAALRRLKVTTEVFGVPDTLAQSLGQVMRIAELVHRPARGAALAARIRAAVAAAAPPPGERPLTALIYQRAGFASAPGTLVDEMMRRAGFINAAGRYGLTRSGAVPLEALIADPPDVLLAGQAEPGEPTWADRVLSHPALRAATASRIHHAVFPQRLIYCGGPVLIETAAMLAAARRAALRART